MISSNAARPPNRHGHFRLHRYRGLDKAPARARRGCIRDGARRAPPHRARRMHHGGRRRGRYAGGCVLLRLPDRTGSACRLSELQRGLAPGPIRVRTGIHTGTPLLADEGYVGHDVHRASRIASAAHGGQVVISTSTAALVDERFELVDLGEHRFKDLAAAERVFQLGSERFPALKSLFRTNLPDPGEPARRTEEGDSSTWAGCSATTPGSSRSPARAESGRRALRSQRHPKRPIASRTASGSSTSRRFAILRSSLPTIAHAIERRRRSRAPPPSTRDRCSCIDNFEQVVAAARESRPPARRVSRTCACSRRAGSLLRISHEQEYSLDPLPEAPAVELFRHRAAAVSPDIELEYAVAAEICLPAGRTAARNRACRRAFEGLRARGAPREARASTARAGNARPRRRRAPTSAPRDDRLELRASR